MGRKKDEGRRDKLAELTSLATIEEGGKEAKVRAVVSSLKQARISLHYTHDVEEERRRRSESNHFRIFSDITREGVRPTTKWSVAALSAWLVCWCEWRGGEGRPEKCLCSNLQLGHILLVKYLFPLLLLLIFSTHRDQAGELRRGSLSPEKEGEEESQSAF